MTTLDSPTKMKHGASFPSKVKFDIFEKDCSVLFHQHSTLYIASALRSDDTIVPPINSNFIKRYIFRKSDKPNTVYMLDPTKYPPSYDGYKTFLEDLKDAASDCGENMFNFGDNESFEFLMHKMSSIFGY